MHAAVLKLYIHPAMMISPVSLDIGMEELPDLENIFVVSTDTSEAISKV